MKRALLVLLLGIAVVTAGIMVAAPAGAASPGAGFGAWAPLSAYGWHGSMSIGGLQTYCISPGRPVPTGDSSDQGLSFDAEGLDAGRLTAINMLVSTYGQTTDPVQAASVGWAVKALADWDETLHSFGYPGDTLAGAIHWTFSALAPEADQAVQDLATAYYVEATAVPAGAATGSGRLEFTTQADDTARGTVTVIADVAEATGTVTLQGAVFADSGAATREVAAGATYDIVAAPPPGQTSYTVSGSGTLRGGFLPAVRFFTTAGGQDTAGPGGILEFPISGEDAAPRETVFAPQVTTQVASRYTGGGAYVDDVSFTSARGAWARTADGGYASVTATATVYRTDTEPVVADAVPADAEAVGTLELTTDPGIGPTVPYRVESPWPVPGPGFYTAVWQVDADEQQAETQAALEPGYSWNERFGEASQVMLVATTSSAAEPEVTVGQAMSDAVIVEGAVPATGLDVWSEVYHVPDGVAIAEACTPENLVWRAPPAHVTASGSRTFTAPEVPDFGTYIWQEHATDADGVPVHDGACGVPAETTVAVPPVVSTRAQEAVGFGGAAVDTATVSGRVPVSGVTEVTFEVYRGDEGAAADSCRPENLVAATAAVPVPTAGEYVSPSVRLETVGPHHWVEYLWWTTPTGERRLLAQGSCGATAETTVVEQPALTTTATARAALGAPFTDAATVTGLGDDVDAELVFTLFRLTPGAEPVCTADSMEATTAPVPVRASGTFVSPTVSSQIAGSKLWIAELRYRATPDAEPVVLARGACGDAGETTVVDSLAATGAFFGVPLPAVGTAGAMSLGGGALVLFMRRRRRVPSSPVVRGGIEDWRP
ncbi:MAG: hypothetical protein QM626_02285 [Microbacterium sp.]|uniref:hypothetical protein n=1 Tax=Microbacterium sp. TaxID=51671 RepID=UPI0039E2FC92